LPGRGNLPGRGTLTRLRSLPGNSVCRDGREPTGGRIRSGRRDLCSRPLPQMSKLGQEPYPAASTPALDRARRHAEHFGSVGDWVVEHVDEDDRDLLIVRQLPERGHDLDRSLTCGCMIGRRFTRSDHLEQPVVSTCKFGPRGTAAHPVQAGVHYDPVQPCGHRGLAPEASCTPEGGDHRVLQRIRRLFRVRQRPDGNGPEPVLVPEEQRAERI
jgi:hypothetical protein